MDRATADFARLRINRMTLIQSIDTHHLLPKLVHARILSIDDDVPKINRGTSRIDRARLLIDCLLAPTSNKIQPTRPHNWFLMFRSILLEDPSLYGRLVAALDSTIIRTPDPAQHLTQSSPLKPHDKPNVDGDKEQAEQSKHTQERITKIEFDRYAMNKVRIEGSFQKVIGNVTYQLQIPEPLFEQLAHSIHSYDHQQLRSEQKAFDDMHRLELMINLVTEDKSLVSHNILFIHVVDPLLDDASHQHHFFKYFFALSSIYGIHFDRELTRAFLHCLDEPKDLGQTIDKGLRLHSFLYNYGRYDFCRQIVASIIRILSKSAEELEHTVRWTYLFRAYTAAVQLDNQNLDVQQAWKRVEAANDTAERLRSIGQGVPGNDYAPLHAAAAQTAYEDANFDACIQYSYRGLKHTDRNNHALTVDLLCSLAQGLTSKWIMNKAQATAIMAVQYAATHCGRSSPKYIYALQQLVHYSNEFIQDSSSVALAQYTFDRARTVYGYDSLVVAHCHRALSKSLIMLASASPSRHHTPKPASDDDQDESSRPASTHDCSPAGYLHHAHEAYRIAQAWFGVDDRVHVLPFKMTLAHGLQAQMAVDGRESELPQFQEAMELLSQCLSVAQGRFGAMSFKVAQIHRLRSAMYLSRQMYDDAEQELNRCLKIYELCLPPNSFHYHVTKASLGLLYKQRGDYQRALPLFQGIAELLDTKTQSFRWINMVLESLIECYSHTAKDANAQESSGSQDPAAKIRSELNEWQRSSAKPVDLMKVIHEVPSRSLERFLQHSTKFQESTDRLHALMHLQQQVKRRP